MGTQPAVPRPPLPTKHVPVFNAGRTVTVDFPALTCAMTQSVPTFAAASMASTGNPVGVLSTETSMAEAAASADSSTSVSWEARGLGLVLTNWLSWALTAAAMRAVSGGASTQVLSLLGGAVGGSSPCDSRPWEQPTKATAAAIANAATGARRTRIWAENRLTLSHLLVATSTFCHRPTSKFHGLFRAFIRHLCRRSRIHFPGPLIPGVA